MTDQLVALVPEGVTEIPDSGQLVAYILVIPDLQRCEVDSIPGQLVCEVDDIPDSPCHPDIDDIPDLCVEVVTVPDSFCRDSDLTIPDDVCREYPLDLDPDD